MQVAGPIHSQEEARGFEQIAFLTHLRMRLAKARRGRPMRGVWPLIELTPDEVPT